VRRRYTYVVARFTIDPRTHARTHARRHISAHIQ